MNDVEDIARWYIIHAYSGHEERVKKNLEQRIETLDIKDKILNVVVPTEDEIEIKSGVRKTISKKVFPGYILVQMNMDDESWHIVRNTPGVTGFISSEDEQEKRSRPIPLEDSEVQEIIKQIESDEPKNKIGYVSGQTVRITEGPFADFLGVVDQVYSDRDKVRELVSFFGRDTPVELDFLQIERSWFFYNSFM